MAKRKRARGGKKGFPFEREMARRLSLWWTGGDNDNVLWRTAQSGGRATTRAKAGKNSRVHCSDLCAIDPVAEPLMRALCIELKKGYSKETIHDLLDKPTRAKRQKYEEWFDKAERDRLRAGALYWVIIHMRDRREPLIWMPAELANNLIATEVLNTDNSVCCTGPCRGVLSATVSLGDGRVVCCETLHAFLEGVTPARLLAILKEATRTEAS